MEEGTTTTAAVGTGGGVGAVISYEGGSTESGSLELLLFELERGVGLIVITLLLFVSISLNIGFCFSLKQQKMSRQLTRVGLLSRLFKSSADSSAV